MSTDTGSLTSEREKTKQRIAKLLNMTCDRGASESEAMMAAGKAAELMAHYDMEASELSLRSVRAIKKASLMRRYGRRVIANHCGYHVAQLCDCMFWRTDGHFVFFGFPEDAEIAAYLFDLVSYGILAEVEIYKATPGYRAEAKSSRVGGRALVGTFIAGMEDRICDRLAVPSAPAGRDYWIIRSEAARLLWETRRDWRARRHLPLYTLIALYTGARRGAILNLTWPQIDLARGIINFNPPGRGQTKKRRPIIRIPRSLLAALRRAHRRATCEYVIAYEGKSVASVKTAFNSAAERAGITDCTSHTLRHTAGTWMAQRGLPMHQIAGYLGHSVARTTELYAHYHPDHMQQAVAALERHSS